MHSISDETLDEQARQLAEELQCSFSEAREWLVGHYRFIEWCTES